MHIGTPPVSFATQWRTTEAQSAAHAESCRLPVVCQTHLDSSGVQPSRQAPSESKAAASAICWRPVLHPRFGDWAQRPANIRRAELGGGGNLEYRTRKSPAPGCADSEGHLRRQRTKRDSVVTR
eukprot:scaffold65064_cov68-Phaeocystis_antarctica.AAC.4